MDPRVAIVALVTLAAAPAPARPRIVGISHVAFRVSDAAAARSFYEGWLGLRGMAVGDRQFLELVPGLDRGLDRLDHVGLATDDVDAMRLYLAARGVEVPDRASRDASGRAAFTVHDPEGHAVEFVPAAPAGSGARAGGTPETEAVSRRILHAGIIAGDVPAAMRFYGDVLGFSETWRGSRSDAELSWINLKVPDGTDYLELMLYGERPAPDARGTQHHACLEVTDVEQARAALEKRPYRGSYARTLEARVGVNRKRQLNLYDPDGTRIELMKLAQ